MEIKNSKTIKHILACVEHGNLDVEQALELITEQFELYSKENNKSPIHLPQNSGFRQFDFGGDKIPNKRQFDVYCESKTSDIR